MNKQEFEAYGVKGGNLLCPLEIHETKHCRILVTEYSNFFLRAPPRTVPLSSSSCSFIEGCHTQPNI